MHNQSIDKIADPIVPLYDTWGGKKSAGRWCIVLPFDFTSLSTQFVKVFFSPSSESDIKGVVLEWQPRNSYEEYIEHVLKAIREYPAAIEELAMQVELLVFVRTEESPHQPIRAWVRFLGELLICGGLEYGEPDFCFSVDHTLFYPFSYHNGANNSELYLVNQPLLENALRRWEERFGSISEVEGLKGIFEYGFKPKEEWAAKSTN
ncbi:hypothetical protein [Nostoc sp. PA-18-2419]|uniref:hypothetical protein n=1 Tax=Nostoc sp. PA-18-2419 TaxID=2575443 RepID=UPI00110968C3|nr:hypothetical protein [Nostoc sp. PA-18-2419]